tara:strand:- start:341 stop:757 length:417 start_codon:yes stop_codon:yes gene_type:complete
MFFDCDPIEVDFSEKALMACKAAFFCDHESYTKIINAKTPSECKKLGRRVKKFDEQTWSEFREFFAFEILKCKFKSNVDMMNILLSTGKNILAEASATDRIWGIGLSESDPRAYNPDQWKGTNLLGKILMRVRDECFQ